MKKIYFLLSFCLIHFIAQAQTIPAYVPTNGLVGWWPFNGNANDESGNGNNGTVNGATLTSDRNGNVGKAYSFDGLTNYINGVINNFSNTSSTSLSAWLQSTGDAGGTPYDLYFEYGSYGNHTFAYSYNYNNQNLNLYSNCFANPYINVYIQNNWHHIVVVDSFNLTKIYIDGTILTDFYSGNNSNCYQGSSHFLIGGGADNQFTTGKLDDIALYNRALTQQEITALFQTTQTSYTCTLSISSQPTNQSSTTGSNASFNVGVTATNCNNPTTYQWQTNTGFGWQTLQHAGQYTGVNTSTLHVSNVGSTNTNQLFRCLIQSGNIADTTQTATLSVVNTGNTTLSAVTHAIPYQAVVRDAAGNPLINHPLTVRCTLHDNTASGTSIYQETHTITTNNLGLFTLHIGTGVASIGNIDSIHWALYKKYLQVEFDTTAQGVSYIDLGTQQLMAVPYALYAETAGNALNAPKGDDGVNGVNGVDGTNGVNGINGVNGVDGISVTSANITNDSLYLSLSNSQTINAGKLNGGLPNGTTAGEMMYWNGTAWVSVAPTTSLPGNQSKTLRFCNGMPTWEDCPAVLPTITSTTFVGNITSTTASSGGNISNDGGASITARGICWSTSNNPTVAITTKTIDGSELGSFNSTITELNPSTGYYVRAYATNNVGTAYGNEITFTTNALNIGDQYQGGIVAYILQPGDPGYDSNTTHGLIAAPSDGNNSGMPWYKGGFITTGATGTALGTGNNNTNIIVSAQGNGNYAAKFCSDLILNGYSDWYLPSLNELSKLFANQSVIGGFGLSNYWSSSENFYYPAWYQDFTNGIQSYYLQFVNTVFQVRAVRSF